MSELEIWMIGWLIGGTITIAAAGLLIWILLVARSLEWHAARTLRALEIIDRNTKPIWGLSSTAGGLEQVRTDTDAMEAALAQLAARLGTHSEERMHE